MKVVNTLRKLGHACWGMLAVACLWSMSSLLFTACDFEENIDPIYAVDLGLSVKWAWCNVGASRPEEYGDYFAWGELATKSWFDRSNYAYYDSSQGDYEDIGANISGTAYDVVRDLWGDGWRLPTEEEMRELIEECTWEKGTLYGSDGMFVTGPNGNKIFLPNASDGYWSGTYSSTNYNYKYSSALTWDYSADVQVDEETCYSGLAVRPVKGNLQSSDEKPDTDEEIGGTEEEIPSKTYIVNGVSFTMIGVEGGTFTMGSPDSDSDAFDDEKPAHQVTLSSYYIGETEVTQELWKAVMGDNPSYFTDDLQRPVECVSWNDCQTFISKLNELTGENFRLPTEAEWEYAARGGNKSKGYKYSGSNTVNDVAWYDDNSSSETHAVKTKQPNELGIYDMSGNVLEWCADWSSSSYYTSSPQTDPTGPSSGSHRVLHGGSWGSYAWGCRVAYRGYFSPGSRRYDFGFRLSLQFIP